MKKVLLIALTLLITTPALLANDQTPPNRERYEKARMEVITKLADFTQEEQDFVQAELLKYDNQRFQAWEESQKIEAEMEKLGDQITEEQYKSNLERLLQLDDQRHDAKRQLFVELNKKLTPRQAYCVYIGMKGNNIRTGRGLRQGNAR